MSKAIFDKHIDRFELGHNGASVINKRTKKVYSIDPSRPTENGYTQVRVVLRVAGKRHTVTARQLAYRLEHGAWPKGVLTIVDGKLVDSGAE